MKKILEGLIAIPIIAFCCSAAPINKNEVELTGLIIQEDTEEYITIRSYYSCNVIGKGHFAIMDTYMPFTDREFACSYTDYEDFNGRTNQLDTISKKILKTDLNVENKFKSYLYINYAEKQKIVLRYRTQGEQQVYFSEKDNNIGVTNKYIVESVSPVDDKHNYVHEDRIKFYNFEDIVVNETYNYFDVSKLRFNYTNGSDDIFKGKVKLAFEDRYANFPDYPLIEDSMYRYIELKIDIDSDGKQYLSFLNPLYYDLDSHKSSPFYRAGYRPTDVLYLPKGKSKELKTINAFIEFDVNGYTDFKATGKFKFTYDKEIIGRCEDSEYCIYISDDTGSEINENIIEVNS